MTRYPRTVAETPRNPYELCERYAVGQIGRAELVETLIHWPYVEPPPLGEEDYNVALPPSRSEQSFRQVLRAFTGGLIDEQTYEEVRIGRSARRG